MSIICDMRSMPSVVTFSTCVSPRLKIAEPCARFSTPTSAESGRMSVAERPSSRMPSSITRLRMTFFCSCFHAGPNSPARAAASSPSTDARCSFASAFSASSFASRSALSGTMASPRRSLANALTASYTSSP